MEAPFKARPGSLFSPPSKALAEEPARTESRGVMSPLVSLGTPFKMPSRRILSEPNDSAETSAGKTTFFSLPRRASALSASSERTEEAQQPIKRPKPSNEVADDLPTPSFFPSANPALAQAKLTPTHEPSAETSSVLRSQLLGKRQRDEEVESFGNAAPLPPLPEAAAEPAIKASLPLSQLEPSALIQLSRKSSLPSLGSKLTLSFGAPKAPANPASVQTLDTRSPSFTKSTISLKAPEAPSFKRSLSPSESAKAPSARALPPLVSDDDKPPSSSTGNAVMPKRSVAPFTLAPRGEQSMPSIRFPPPQSPERHVAPIAAKHGQIDFFPRAIAAKGSAECPTTPKVGHRLPSADPILAKMRGTRAVPDTRHAEELETAFLSKAQEFAKRLEDMNEGLADAAEKLKEQAVHLFVLNNEALFMNSPALSDRIADLRAQFKAMRVDPDGLALTQKEE